MKIFHQFQDYGSELLGQPRDCFWIFDASPDEERALDKLCQKIDGSSNVRAARTGIDNDPFIITIHEPR